MSIKKIALVAATVAATSTIANADTFFDFGETLNQSSIVDLGLISADANAVVEIYDEAAGERGTLLGSKNLSAGANSDVRVNLGSQPLGDVIAVIRIDGEIVAERKYDIEG